LDAQIVIIPGTKRTITDLRWMKSRGLDSAVANAAAKGAFVVGIYGGYQMLGESLDDPDGADGGEPDSEPGLGLLPVRTVFSQDKVTSRVELTIAASADGSAMAMAESGSGFEIHSGETSPAGGVESRSLLEIDHGDGVRIADGAVSPDGNVIGSMFTVSSTRQRCLSRSQHRSRTASNWSRRWSGRSQWMPSLTGWPQL
jgi:adenosylcobyric acid synthase